MAAFVIGLFEDLEDCLDDLLVEDVPVEGRPFASREDGE